MTSFAIRHALSLFSAPVSKLRRLLLRVVLPVWLIFYLVLCCHTAQAFEAPAFQGDVFDEAGILTESDRASLRERIRTLRETDDIWAAVFIMRSFQQASVEEAAVLTFEKWKLGQKGKDNGLLVLLVPDERKIRIEVGYGLEGVITDVLSRRIIDEVYAPAFREQRYVDGLLRGFDVMVKAKNGAIALPEASSKPAEQAMNWSGAGMRFGLSLLFNLLPVAGYALALRYGRQHGRIRKSERDEDVRTPFFLCLFFGLFFGIFYAVFGAAFPDDSEVIRGLIGGNVLFAGVFGIPYLLKARRFLSQKAYQSYQASSSWFSTSESHGSSRWDSSSSSSSSSSSDSSSSDGGSSGGGGASGSW